MQTFLRAALAALAVFAASSAQAQDGRLTGRVLYSDQSTGVPYATVTLTPTGGSRFADDSGTFNFVHLAAGTYHVRARQIGFSPSDTTVQIAAAGVTTITMRLRHVARIQRVVVRAAAGKCVKPGVPDSTVDPELAQLFSQVKENVVRLRILMNDYPFRYRRIDEFVDHGGGGADRLVDADTLTLESWDQPEYEPGRVVVTDVDRKGRTGQYMHLVQFWDLSDVAFEQNHCFRIAERDNNPNTLLELDFRPADTLKSPDISGSIFLDPDRYIVKRAVFHLTRPHSLESPLRDWTYSSTFSEVVPLVPVVNGFHSIVQSPRQAGEMIEDGRVTDYKFIREAPVDPSVHDTLAGSSEAKTVVAQAAFQAHSERSCSPPPPQPIVEALTAMILPPTVGDTGAAWSASARTLLMDMRTKLDFPSTFDLETFGYAAPASATDAAGRGALRVAPGVFGRYALSFGQSGVVEDVRVVSTSMSSDIDSAIVIAARGAVSKNLRGRTVVLSVTTSPRSDTLANVPLVHVQAPSWLLTRASALALPPGVAPPPAVAAAGDTAAVEFILDDTGHPVLPTVHRVGSLFDRVGQADMDSLTLAATDSLSSRVYRPALVGRCAVSQVTTQRFIFRRAGS